MTDLAFTAFPKIARHRREVVVSEKINGSNGVVHVAEDGTVLAGSRTRWITPESDNFSFARWVKDHEDELRMGLGFGTHYGEWMGGKIQVGYGLTEKRFYLFNAGRWSDDAVRPKCCHVVPVLYRGPNSERAIEACLERLRKEGSVAVPGFNDPEGIVIFHTASSTLTKITLKADEEPKGKAEWLAKEAARLALKGGATP